MAVSSQPEVFSFGVEIKIYLKPKKLVLGQLLKEYGYNNPADFRLKTRNRMAVLKAVAFSLSQDEFKAVVAGEGQEDEYDVWQVKSDSSLCENLGAEFCKSSILGTN
jgi:hypothetical protein